jgi:hypothetical protein
MCSSVLGSAWAVAAGVGCAGLFANGFENQLDEPPVGELVHPASAKAQHVAGINNPKRRRTGFLLTEPPVADDRPGAEYIRRLRVNYQQQLLAFDPSPIDGLDFLIVTLCSSAEDDLTERADLSGFAMRTENAVHKWEMIFDGLQRVAFNC